MLKICYSFKGGHIITLPVISQYELINGECLKSESFIEMIKF